MAVLPITVLGTPILRQATTPVAAVTDDLRALADDMFETMRAASGLGLARSLGLTSSEAMKQGLKVNQDGLRRSALELMAMAEIGFEGVCRLWPELRQLSDDVVEALEAEALYSGYIRRQQSDIEALRKEDQLALPLSLDYASMPSLSSEIRQKLLKVRPTTLGQASRIDGITPAALAVILGHVKRRDRQTAA